MREIHKVDLYGRTKNIIISYTSMSFGTFAATEPTVFDLKVIIVSQKIFLKRSLLLAFDIRRTNICKYATIQIISW